MKPKVQWGVLSTANIGVQKVLPAMQRSERCEIAAIASRDLATAKATAARLGIPKAYGSYEELLADPEIEAVYNPLPNHLHVPWTVKAAEAGKHVLCEKPISLTVAEGEELLAAQKRTGVLIEEAFMVRTHTQWEKAIEIAQSGRLGTVRAVQGFFSYHNVDPENIRNIREYGGGGLMDIGCYLIYTSRLVFGQNPTRVVAVIEEDPKMHTDILTSGLLDFPSGQATFTSSTQLVPYQRVQVFGTKARLEVVIPFNAPPNRACLIRVDDGSDLFGGSAETIEFPVCDQYSIQGDRFAASIRDGVPLPVSLEGSIHNMAVIEAVFRSAKSGNWEKP
jgi:predicted dehydrogenase